MSTQRSCLGALCITIVLLCTSGSVEAKRVQGLMALTSEECEQFVEKFSFSGQTQGKIAGHFFSNDQHYFDGQPHSLMVALFDKQGWKKYNKLLKKGSLCNERMQVATYTKRISPREHSNPESFEQDLQGEGPDHERLLSAQEEFGFSWEVKVKQKSHFWYLLMADCFLENYPAHPPKIRYDVVFLDGDSHLSADQKGLSSVYLAGEVVLIVGAAFFIWRLHQQYKISGQLHLSGLLLCVAMILQFSAVALELRHLVVMEQNGFGLSWTSSWLMLDFLSDVFQNLSEYILSVLLLALSLGWTLSVGTGPRSGKLIAAIAFVLGLVTVGLELWALRFKQGFSAFHDHEHLPGYIFIFMRFMLCVAFLAGCLDTKQRFGDATSGGAKFMTRLMVIGGMWLMSFPFMVIVIAPLVKESDRHFIVTTAQLFLQALALMGMSFMFYFPNSEYFKMSTLSHMGTVFAAGANSTAAGRSVMQKLKQKVAVD